MKTSLGTLAAVAAIAAAATTASAEVQYATHLFGDIVDTDFFYIDINNDGIADYEIMNGNRLEGQYQFHLEVSNTVASTAPGVYDPYLFSFGDTLDGSYDYSQRAYITTGTSFIVGLSFYIDEAIHFGWLQFGIDEGDLVILDGAWQDTANAPLDIIAVPEPSTVAAGIALLAGAAVALRRRSGRRHCA